MGLRRWLGARVGDKAAGAIILAAFLGAIGAALAKPLIDLFDRGVQAVVPASEFDVSIFAQRASNTQPLSGVKVSFLDRNLKAQVVSSDGGTFLMTENGVARGDLSLKAGPYALNAEYTEAGTTYGYFKPIQVSGPFIYTVEFDPDKWFSSTARETQISVSRNATLTPSDVRSAPWMQIAQNEIGVSEIAGGGSNPTIERYWSAVPNWTIAVDDSIPWNGAFVAWVLSSGGFAVPNSPAMARAWLSWGSAVELKPGCIAVLWRGSPNSFMGHVGFVVDADEETLFILGGNQLNQVNISKIARTRLLGCRWPQKI